MLPHDAFCLRSKVINIHTKISSNTIAGQQGKNAQAVVYKYIIRGIRGIMNITFIRLYYRKLLHTNPKNSVPAVEFYYKKQRLHWFFPVVYNDWLLPAED